MESLHSCSARVKSRLKRLELKILVGGKTSYLHRTSLQGVHSNGPESIDSEAHSKTRKTSGNRLGTSVQISFVDHSNPGRQGMLIRFQLGQRDGQETLKSVG